MQIRGKKLSKEFARIEIKGAGPHQVLELKQALKFGEKDSNIQITSAGADKVEISGAQSRKLPNPPLSYSILE